VSIQTKRIVLDTNVWIYGLCQDRSHPGCSELLDKLRTLRVIIPRQVLIELQLNLSTQEYQRFWQLLKASTARTEISWDPARMERLDGYRRLGCRRGDAAVAALTGHVGAEVLVTENRDFLRDVPNLPFRVLSSADFLAELGKGSA
jgi:predicted nucleic acid-binding protein